MIATGVIRTEGTSKEYAPIEFPAVVNLDITNALLQAAKDKNTSYHAGVVQCKDSFYGQYEPGIKPVSYELQNKWDAWKRMGCLASEMESAALFIVATFLKKFVMLGKNPKRKRGVRVKDFEKIYSEYYDTVFQYALSLCKNEQWAEEITQNAFFKALKSIDTFRGECKLSVWLCQIAKHTFYTAAKQQQRQVDYPLELIPSEETIEQKLLDKEAALQIHSLLHSLDEPYKEVFWMRTFGELSFKEIGELFGKTESWARVTYHRARMKIKEGVK